MLLEIEKTVRTKRSKAESREINRKLLDFDRELFALRKIGREAILNGEDFTITEKVDGYPKAVRAARWEEIQANV